MAIITKTAAVLEEVCTWSYDYDNVALKLVSVKCVNNHPTFASEGKLISQSTGQEYVQVVQPLTPFGPQNIPPAVVNRYNIGVDVNGRVTGVDHIFRMVPAS